MAKLEIDINDLETLNLDDLELELGCDDLTGMLVINSHSGLANIGYGELKRLRDEYEKEIGEFVDRIYITGYKKIKYKNEVVGFDVSLHNCNLIKTPIIQGIIKIFIENVE